MADNNILRQTMELHEKAKVLLTGPHIWDTLTAYNELRKLGEANSKRTAERRLKDWGVVPALLTARLLADDKGNNPVGSILEWEINLARTKRKTVLFVQLHSCRGHLCLHANDARGARYWVSLKDKDETVPDINDALVRLQKHMGKPIAFFPHAQLVPFVRELSFSSEITPCFMSYPPVLERGALFSSTTKVKATGRNRSYLDKLEAESIFILREAITSADNPVMLYSCGKDSSVLLHLALKAFYPALPPFPLLHIDTLWKFREMYLFRDMVARKSGMKLLTYVNPELVERKISPLTHGSAIHTDISKTQALRQALNKWEFDMIIGGARRDEDGARAKERIFSFRNQQQGWDPRYQRPEIFNLYNTTKRRGETFRVFPLSNWTELDIWHYISRENIPVPPLYFSKERPVISRDGLLLVVDDDRLILRSEEKIFSKKVRFRTLGCYPLSGATESNAQTVSDIMVELIRAKSSERSGRLIDKDSSYSMEKKKKEGYF